MIVLLQRNSGALSDWPSGSWSPPRPRPFSPDCSLWWPALGRVLVIQNFFHLRMMEATVLGDLQSCRNVLVLFPRSVTRHIPISKLYGQFLRPHGLVLALTCTVNSGTLSRLVCAFPNYVQSIEFTRGGLQTSCRNISRMINGNRMHLSTILSLIAKGLNTYLNKVFLVLFYFKKSVFTLSLWGIMCRLMRNYFYLIHFRIRL